MARPRTLPPPGAVIFDLDGTLVDTVPTRIRAWTQVFAEEDIPVDARHLASLIGADGRRLAREVASRAGRRLDPGDDERIDKRSGEIYAELNRRPRVLPGAGQALDAIEAAGIPWAIATSSRRDQVHASVGALRRPTPPMVVDGSSVKHAKPAPDLLLRAAGELGVAPNLCWCVGDATWDMRAARAAGMLPVGITTGAADAAALTAAGAVVTLSSLRELPVSQPLLPPVRGHPPPSTA